MSTIQNSVLKQAPPFSDRWVILLGIPLVGIVMPVLFGVILQYDFSKFAFNMLAGFINTVALWTGCRYILRQLWAKLPWQRYPYRHLVIEIVLITAYTFLVTGVLWLLISGFSIVCFQEVAFLNIFFASAGISLIISFVHEGLYFFHQWKFSLVRSETLEKEYYVSQFETLKSQVNPHFLFNSLNTLIGLIEENRDNAIEYVQKLSDFYRTIIQLRNQPLISVHDEKALILNYYDIQHQRYGQNLELNIQLDDASLEGFLPPLTLQMLVENAIKHNMIATGRPLRIDIVSVENGYLVVKNNLQRRELEEPSGGLGLQNIRNRFALLTDKPVEIVQSVTAFTVAVPVIFTKNQPNQNESADR